MMNRVLPLLSAVLAIGGLPSAGAVESVQTQIGAPQIANTQTAATARSQASQWGLTLDEYRRYEALMKGVRGSISDLKISPIEVLGIHARSEAERQKYAEQFARIMAEDTERILQFQLAYQMAFKRLYPALPAIYVDPSTNRSPSLTQVLNTAPQLPTTAIAQKAGFIATGPRLPFKTFSQTESTAVKPGDRLIVFTKATQCGACDALVGRATKHTTSGVVVDVYVADSKTPNEVANYANRLRLDPQLVRSGRVTLNLDNGTMARVLPTEKALPQVVRKRGELLTTLAVNEL